ncbi:uncharacterized protein LOC143032133 isoform X1 [Oratosquilla oratoria]|uniref:uncharacterized protein LOC143032133 isoform X1 n=1 Tax=Oratosquilla oratoria TaxID=337810 RepID=UPI003F75D1AD
MSCRECSDITGMLRERRRPEMMLQRVWRKHSSRTAVSTSAEVKHETITANDSISTSSSNKKYGTGRLPKWDLELRYFHFIDQLQNTPREGPVQPVSCPKD